ncbi:hypothetical protein ACP70R_046129 [Stipagrostis hirtigluma subsp. patula]
MLLNAIGEYQFVLFLRWFMSLDSKMASAHSMLKAFTYAIGVWIFFPVVTLAYGPLVCFGLSLDRLRHQDYGSDDGDESKANLKPALNIFYSLSLAQGALFMSVLIFQKCFGAYIPVFIRLHGFSRKVVIGYTSETEIRCQNNPEPTKNWNLITYGVGLLDSGLPDDFMWGARVLNMLIEQKIPIKWHLLRSPRHRIQLLIEALGWRSPSDRVTRELAARIVAHLASDLNLSEFPGAIECISSLLDTYYHKGLFNYQVTDTTREQEVFYSPSGSRNIGNGTPRRMVSLAELIRKFKAPRNGTMQDTQRQKNEELILQGLRILENLAHNRRNCTEIYNRGLLSKITGPLFYSDKLNEDIGMNVEWNKVVNASLRVVSCLMEDPGDTGMHVRHHIACNSKAIANLEAVLGQEGNSNILELQTHALDVLAKLFSDEATNVSRDIIDSFIWKALDIFLTDTWMEDYFQDQRKRIDQESRNQLVEDDNGPSFFWEKLCPSLLQKRNNKRANALMEKKLKEAQETWNQHKEKAGEVLAMLSMRSTRNSEAIMNFTGCENVVLCLAKMLDCKIKTIGCSISATETSKYEFSTGCRISAARILKHLCGHSTMNDDSVKKTLLKKVLEELLNINRNTETRVGGRNSRNSCSTARNDVENPPLLGSDDHQERSTCRSLQQLDDRMLHAAQLSLYATIRATWAKADDFASLIVQLVASNDFVGNLKMVIEENNYPTPACLAILKVTCEIIILLMQHNHYLPVIKDERIIDTLYEASETMAGVESSLLFSGVEHDCYGVPVKPLSSVLVKQARNLLSAKIGE